MRRALTGLLVCAAAIAAAPPVLAAPIHYPQTAFFWSLPAPTAESASSLSFSGQRGYELTSYSGQLLTTGDGGTTWDELTPPPGIVSDLDATSDDTVYAEACDLLRSTDRGRHFAPVAVSTAKGRCLRDATFSGPADGYVLLAEGAVARTSDGGATWAQAGAVPGVNEQTKATALAAAGPGVLLAVRDGFIYRSADGGGTWSQVASAPNPLYSVAVAPGGTAYAGGGSGTLLRSTDGGVTWERRTLAGGPGNETGRIVCAAAERCLLFTRDQPNTIEQPYWTGDGGATATKVTPGPDGVAVDSRGRLVTGADGGVSVDLGRTFTFPTGLGSGLQREGRTLYSYRETTLGRSTDGGQTWALTGVPLRGKEQLAGISFTDARHGVARTERRLLRTTDGGRSWRSSAPGGLRALWSLTSFPRGVVMAIDGKHVFRLTPRGRRFEAVGSRALRRLNPETVSRDGGLAVARGLHGVAISRNQGRTWSRLRTPRGLHVVATSFVSRRLVYAGGGDRLYRTHDGGRHWRLLPATAGAAISGLSFRDARHGIVDTSTTFEGDHESVASGSLAVTADGGHTFTPISLGESGLVTGFASLPGMGLVVATDGALIRSPSGGRGPVATRLSFRAARKRVRRGVRVTLSCRLAGTRRQVSVMQHDSEGWTGDDVFPATDGRFRLTRTIRETTTFVARVDAGPVDAGAGTPAVRVTIPRR